MQNERSLWFGVTVLLLSRTGKLSWSTYVAAPCSAIADPGGSESGHAT